MFLFQNQIFNEKRIKKLKLYNVKIVEKEANEIVEIHGLPESIANKMKVRYGNDITVEAVDENIEEGQ